MNQETDKDIILNKVEVEDNIDEIYISTTWTKKESIQVFWFFIIAFVMLLIFGYLVNRFLL